MAGKLQSPKYMIIGLYSPLAVLNATFYQSSSLICILLQPFYKSSFIKNLYPFIWSSRSLTSGNGYVFLTVASFSNLQSYIDRSVLSFFPTKKNGEACGNVDSRINPFSKFSCKNMSSVSSSFNINGYTLQFFSTKSNLSSIA